MDLTLDVGNYRLNIRSAALIVHNNKVLVHKNKNDNGCRLPGGRVEIGESSKKAVKREIMEELGKKIEITGYAATIENFFEHSNKKFHEIYFLYNAEFADEEDKKIEYTMKNMEGKEYLTYEWLDIDKIDNYNLLPVCLKKVVKNKQFPVHVINDDFENKIEVI